MLPKKLGTGPSFLDSVIDEETDSGGLLKKSDGGGTCALGLSFLSSGLDPAVGPNVNLGADVVSVVGAAKEKDDVSPLVFLDTSVGVSNPPRRPSREPPDARGSVCLGTSAFETSALPKLKPVGNIFAGILILASSVASGRSSSSSSSSQALNLPEL